MADLVKTHLESGAVCSPQYPLNCAQCVNPMCRNVMNPIAPYQKIRDVVLPEGELTKANPIKADGFTHQAALKQ